MPNLPAAKLMDPVIGSDVHAVGQVGRLRRIGLSALGAFEVSRGRRITSDADRALVANIVAKAFSRRQLRAQGLSALGVAQLRMGIPVSRGTDRTLVGNVFSQAAAKGFGMHHWSRFGHEVIVG